MTLWSPQAIMRFWIRNGGDPGHVVNAVAVAWAESRGDDSIQSPADDWGLWQINSRNFAAQGVNRITICDPDVNARIAVRMSGNGTNWAAWCTCWAQPAGNCGHGYLPDPESGSPAGNQLDFVRSSLTGLVDQGQAPLPAGSEDEINGAWSYLQDFVGNWSHGMQGKLMDATNALKGLTR